MKPIIKVKLNRDGEEIAKLETELITKIYQLFKSIDFDDGTIRVTYGDGMYNEATFKTKTDCKVLATVFRERPLLDYIYKKEL